MAWVTVVTVLGIMKKIKRRIGVDTIYFPIQNFEKIVSSRSSVVIEPVSSPK